jgi:hypothetical protein
MTRHLVDLTPSAYCKGEYIVRVREHTLQTNCLSCREFRPMKYEWSYLAAGMTFAVGLLGWHIILMF